MERLTKRIPGGIQINNTKYLFDEMDKSTMQKALERLAAYEDSSLNPEDVKSLAEGKAVYEAYDGSKLDKADQYIERLENELANYKKIKEKLPEIVCLCGSTRFYDVFQKTNYELTMQGKIVLTVGFYMHSQEQAHGQNVGCTPEQKIALDELHKRKIDLCDMVLVLNVGGYIGESTRSEIEYAEKIGKPVYYLETSEISDEEIFKAMVENDI